MTASANANAAVGTTRVYRLSIWIRLIAAAFVVFTILGFCGLLWRQTPGLEGRNPGELVEWAAIAAFAAAWALYVYGAAVVLTDNAIVKRTPLKTDELRFHEIRGRRTRVYRNFDGSYIRYLRVIPRDSLFAEIRFQEFYAFDAVFKDWFYALPDLDRESQANSLN
jgi:hypothetical protein